MTTLSYPLESRPQGVAIKPNDPDMLYVKGLGTGWVVTLRHLELRITAQIVDSDQEDEWLLGQVTDLDGFADPQLADLRIGSFIRFKPINVFTAHQI